MASWNATTPPGTWLQVELLGTYSNGEKTPAYVMGRWASGDTDVARTSVDDQSDGYSRIDTDTFRTTGDVTLATVSPHDLAWPAALLGGA